MKELDVCACDCGYLKQLVSKGFDSIAMFFVESCVGLKSNNIAIIAVPKGAIKSA